MVLKYPLNAKELIWTFQLIFARFFMWTNVFFDTKFKNKHYADAWERSDSAR